MGFSYEECRKLNPRLIYASISGYVRLSDVTLSIVDALTDKTVQLRANWPLCQNTWLRRDHVSRAWPRVYKSAAFADQKCDNSEAEAGLMHITGEEDGPPVKVGVAVTGKLAVVACRVRPIESTRDLRRSRVRTVRQVGDSCGAPLSLANRRGRPHRCEPVRLAAIAPGEHRQQLPYCWTGSYSPWDCSPKVSLVGARRRLRASLNEVLSNLLSAALYRTKSCRRKTASS